MNPAIRLLPASILFRTSLFCTSMVAAACPIEPAAPAGAAGAIASPPASPVASSGDSPVDSIGDLIARGREALEAGRAPEAQKIFEQAAEQDKNSLRTRTWVLRSWMDQGRVNDSLDAIDELAKGDAPAKGDGQGAAIDYLYGMAFARKARGYIESNVAGGPIQMALEDAVQFLGRAVKADPELARDAFVPLAESAWYAQKLDVARGAADAAVKRTPKSADAQFILGRVALSQYCSTKDDEAKAAEADGHWETAKVALASAAELLGTPSTSAGIDKLTRVRVDLGHTFVWKQQLDPAQREYALAIVLKPSLVDMGEIHRAIGGERFLVTVEGAVQAIAARAGGDPADVATLTWWLGWARFDQKQYEKADEAFMAAVAKEPKFLNSWLYIAQARYHVQDNEGALAALRRYWDENPSELVAAIEADPDTHLKILDGLVAWCAAAKRNVEAAFLSELQALAAPDPSRYWNNTGLFWRDAGEALLKSERPEDRKEAMEDFEKSWKAYTKALELEPENPALLNDAAVILHYYLDRELDRAKTMYKQAAERARVELLREDLAKELRELYETALRDSTENLAKLERGEKRP